MAMKGKPRRPHPPAPDEPHLEGKKAPDFELSDARGEKHRLFDLLKRARLVLYFYPKDMTPGCTAEACAFRDRLREIRALGAEVVGVSADAPASHAKFTEVNALNFPLLSDPDHRVAKLYGVYKKKALYGREFMGIERATFVIDRAGVIKKAFSRVKVAGHADAVIEALKADG